MPWVTTDLPLLEIWREILVPSAKGVGVSTKHPERVKSWVWAAICSPLSMEVT